MAPDGHDGLNDPYQEAEGELSMARLALDDGELGHAAQHVATALLHAPNLFAVHELLLARLSLDDFPLAEPLFLGTALARAHLLAARGGFDEALALIGSVQQHEPRGHWADVPWMVGPDLPGKVSPATLCTVIVGLAQALHDPVDEEERPALEPFVQLVRNAAQTYPGEAMLWWAGSMLMRRAGRAEEAVKLAEHSSALEPSLQAAVAAACAYRNLERWTEAEAAMHEALRIEPGNLYVRTDLAELVHRAGRPGEALRWAEEVLDADPRHESAYPTACGMRFEADGELRHLLDLAAYLAEHPGNTHASSVLANQSGTRPWLRRPADASEAVINVLFQVLEQEEGVEGGSLRVSAPEPPSAMLAFGRALPGFTLVVEAVPEPDPRLPVPETGFDGPVRSVSQRVWRYEGTGGVPAVAPPGQEAAQAVAVLAEQPWPHLPGAFDQAVRLAATSLDELLGVMVHPPALPFDDLRAWPLWLRQVQAWACLGIAHHRGDQPWASSERRQILVDLAYGPEDWVSEAALLAMIATAWVDQAARQDVAALVGWRFLAAVQASRTRPVTILESLSHLALATPDLEPGVRSLALAMLDDDDEPPR
ncbi:tetratricopeptide repeat protein [Nonomuraea sp. NPDC050663]|uniref:tetratricopeptide repeat protein n=1 Tax=Nonomuraea sp. NPDC050663 TaxID=3364370 RepID=UPI00378E36C5